MTDFFAGIVKQFFTGFLDKAEQTHELTPQSEWKEQERTTLT